MKGKIKKCGKRILAYVLVGAFVAGSIPAALPVNAAGSSFFEEPTIDNQDDGFLKMRMWEPMMDRDSLT